jgi:peptidoglycan/xylan/chitin deacetylase (PgdA/CDA1 family)
VIELLLQQLAFGVSKLFPDALFYKQTQERVVALTIDDVPTPDDPEDRSTRLILDAIALFNQEITNPEERARATFFIISGHLNHNSTILQLILQDGHEIGNHGLVDDTHAWLHPQEFERQLKEAHDLLLNLTSLEQIRWYRPGRGLYNQEMLKAIQRLSDSTNYELKLALASMIPIDTYEILHGNHQFIAWYINQFVFPGAILVLHGGSIARAKQTAAALPIILKELRCKHYRVLTLSELWDLD